MMHSLNKRNMRNSHCSNKWSHQSAVSLSLNEQAILKLGIWILILSFLSHLISSSNPCPFSSPTISGQIRSCNHLLVNFLNSSLHCFPTIICLFSFTCAITCIFPITFQCSSLVPSHVSPSSEEPFLIDGLILPDLMYLVWLVILRLMLYDTQLDKHNWGRS